MKTFALPFLVAGTFFVFPAGAEEGKEPFYQDEFSGRTVNSMEMASALVVNRFYNAPRYGTRAPSFAAEDIETGETVLLKELYAEKPVVLLFSSWGCDVMRDSSADLLAVYERFRADFSFVMIYIREAHSLDGHHSRLGRVKDPKSAAERKSAAQGCRKALKLPFRILTDRIDDRIATRWGAWPIRLFVVNTEGTVVYSGKPGPWGYSPGNGFKADLADELKKHADRFSQESLEDFLESCLRGKN
ncbi:MAG: redoxin domain-containing protein [Verrucomicrobiales bacterium]|nr:redoxin domain-containing protein [Verrucomicrobiales bacterium]